MKHFTMEKQSWSSIHLNKIEESLKDVREKDLRFFRIDEFKRNLERVGDFSEKCAQCNKFIIDINEAVEKINETIQIPGKERRSYDKLISRLSRHMQKEHQFYPPYYFSYLFSFFGIVIGLLLGAACMKLWFPANYNAVWIGFSVGVVIAYIWGSVKDKKVRAQKKLM
jgi:hypothetical protein